MYGFFCNIHMLEIRGSQTPIDTPLCKPVVLIFCQNFESLKKFGPVFPEIWAFEFWIFGYHRWLIMTYDRYTTSFVNIITSKFQLLVMLLTWCWYRWKACIGNYVIGYRKIAIYYRNMFLFGLSSAKYYIFPLFGPICQNAKFELLCSSIFS